MCCWDSVQNFYESFFAISGKLLFIPLEFLEKKITLISTLYFSQPCSLQLYRKCVFIINVIASICAASSSDNVSVQFNSIFSVKALALPASVSAARREARV